MDACINKDLDMQNKKLGSEKLSRTIMRHLFLEIKMHPLRSLLISLIIILASFSVSSLSGEKYVSSILINIGKVHKHELETINELELFLRSNYKIDNRKIEFIKNLGKPDLIKINIRSEIPGQSKAIANEIVQVIEKHHTLLSLKYVDKLAELDSLYLEQEKILVGMLSSAQKIFNIKTNKELSIQILYFISLSNLGDLKKKILHNQNEIIKIKELAKPKISIEGEVQIKKIKFFPTAVALTLLVIFLFIVVKLTSSPSCNNLSKTG